MNNTCPRRPHHMMKRPYDYTGWSDFELKDLLVRRPDLSKDVHKVLREKWAHVFGAQLRNKINERNNS